MVRMWAFSLCSPLFLRPWFVLDLSHSQLSGTGSTSTGNWIQRSGCEGGKQKTHSDPHTHDIGEGVCMKRIK